MLRYALIFLSLSSGVLRSEEFTAARSLTEISDRLSVIESRLSELPERVRYPIGGGLGHGWIVHEKARQEVEWVRLEFPEPTPLSSLTIVPCVNIDAAEGFGSYGAPRDLTVNLETNEGNTLTLFEGPVPEHFAEGGLPLFLEVPVIGSVRQVEVILDRSRQGEDTFFCLSEIFAIHGELQASLHASVQASSRVRTLSAHYWSPEYLNDGQSSIGQPVDLGKSEWRYYRANLSPNAADEAGLTFHLREPSRISEVRLFPVFPRVNSMKLADYAYGLPERLECELLDSSGELHTSLPPFRSDPREFNPTRNLIVFKGEGGEVRSVRLRISEARHSNDLLPALALGEVQILNTNGENVAATSSIESKQLTESPGRPEGSQQFKLLVDDRSRWGEILPLEEWLRGLDERGRLQSERASLLFLEATLKQRRADQLQTLAIVGIAAVLVLGLALWRTRRQRRLELETVKQQIAGDLHDEVGSNLASINLLATGMGEQPIPGVSEKISEITRETEESLREIVWVLHPRTEDPLPRIREAAIRLLEDIDVTFRIDDEVDLGRLELRQRHHLVLWCKEAFHNIRKHAGATEATVSMKVSERTLEVQVLDNGCGLQSSSAEEDSEMLAKLKERAGRMNGRMEVDSSSANGTRLTLAIPTKK
ncbi:MAG: histidine kinase [Verrucomicrobiota bacterium]